MNPLDKRLSRERNFFAGHSPIDTIYVDIQILAFGGRRLMDEIDYRILCEIQWNARITNTELADKVGLSPSPCWNRLRNLEKQGVIENYVTIFNQHALGVPDTAVIYLTLDRHDDEVLKKFEESLAKLPEVVEAYLVTGDYDYYVKVAVAGTESYEEFLRKKLYKIPGIRHSHTSFTLRCLKRTFSALPSFEQIRAATKG